MQIWELCIWELREECNSKERMVQWLKMVDIKMVFVVINSNLQFLKL
jgi:hypothetical protein